MGRRYVPWMLSLTGMFVFRVLAQFLQFVYPVDFLPPFENWHGEVLPYPVLVGFQIAIVVILGVIF
ncbi:MAG: hypothetical protein HN578_15100, partial [Rhodospirillales bacterium]|nr:hypothetical protein [Rhodospirillales bacterium]